MKQVAITTVSWYQELGYRQGIELVRYDPILSHRLEKVFVTGILSVKIVNWEILQRKP